MADLKPLPINTLVDGDSHRLAAAMRKINTTVVSKKIPNHKVAELADQLESLAEELATIDAEKRTREFGEAESAEKTSAGSSYDYGGGTSLSYQPVSGNCNAVSPQVKYFRAEDHVLGKVTFSNAYEGPPGHVHGGYLAAVLDEVFGITASHSYISDPCMTGTLKMIYRLPVPINQEITYKGWYDGDEGRKVFLKCSITDSNDNLLAEGEAIFLKIDPEMYKKLAG